MLTDKSLFDAYPDLINADMANKLKKCFARFEGNGNILETFNISESLT